MAGQKGILAWQWCAPWWLDTSRFLRDEPTRIARGRLFPRLLFPLTSTDFTTGIKFRAHRRRWLSSSEQHGSSASDECLRSRKKKMLTGARLSRKAFLATEWTRKYRITRTSPLKNGSSVDLGTLLSCTRSGRLETRLRVGIRLK